MPSFQATQSILLQPGGSATVELTVNRNGYEGPLELCVENLPNQVTGSVPKLEAKQTTTRLQITAGAAAPDARQPARGHDALRARSASTLLLQINRTPFHVKAFQVVNLKPGETKRIEVPVERSSYRARWRSSPRRCLRESPSRKRPSLRTRRPWP